MPGATLVRLDIDGGSTLRSPTPVRCAKRSLATQNVPEAVLAELDRRVGRLRAGVLDSKVIQQITNSYSAAFLATGLSGSGLPADAGLRGTTGQDHVH